MTNQLKASTAKAINLSTLPSSPKPKPSSFLSLSLFFLSQQTLQHFPTFQNTILAAGIRAKLLTEQRAPIFPTEAAEQDFLLYHHLFQQFRASADCSTVSPGQFMLPEAHRLQKSLLNRLLQPLPFPQHSELPKRPHSQALRTTVHKIKATQKRRF